MYSDTTIPRAEGSMVTYTCTAGFELTGTSVRMCTDSGWEGTAPTCRGKDCFVSLYAISIIIFLYSHLYYCICIHTVVCQDLPSLANGVISYDTMFSPRPAGTVATYTCDTGYDIFVPRIRTCQSDTTWSGGDIVCQGIFLYCLSL